MGIRTAQPGRLIANADLIKIASLMEQGLVKAFIGDTFTLQEVKQAHMRSKSGHGRGRIVIRVS